MNKRFNNVEMVVVNSVIAVWSFIGSVVLFTLEPGFQAFLYIIWTLCLPIGLLLWSLFKGDCWYFLTFVLWIGIYFSLIIFSSKEIFWVFARILPVVAIIAGIIFIILRWGKKQTITA